MFEDDRRKPTPKELQFLLYGACLGLSFSKTYLVRNREHLLKYGEDYFSSLSNRLAEECQKTRDEVNASALRKILYLALPPTEKQAPEPDKFFGAIAPVFRPASGGGGTEGT